MADDLIIDRCPICGEQVAGIESREDKDGPMPLLSIAGREVRMKCKALPCGHEVTTEARVEFRPISKTENESFHRLALHRPEDRPSWP